MDFIWSLYSHGSVPEGRVVFLKVRGLIQYEFGHRPGGQAIKSIYFIPV